LELERLRFFPLILFLSPEPTLSPLKNIFLFEDERPFLPFQLTRFEPELFRPNSEISFKQHESSSISESVLLGLGMVKTHSSFGVQTGD
jgi:hypothetical protein